MNITFFKDFGDVLSNEWTQFGICMIVLAISVFLVGHLTSTPEAPQLPPLRGNLTVEELRLYDGTGADGRILVALNGNIYDVTKEKQQYLPNGLYAAYAGRDCSRSLATYNLDPITRNTYDDLNDLTPLERESINEWEIIFRQKYDLVGRLLPSPASPMRPSEHAMRAHLELLNAVAEEVRRAEQLAIGASEQALANVSEMPTADNETDDGLRDLTEAEALKSPSDVGREVESALVLNALCRKLREAKLPPNVINIDHDADSTEC